eukprot:scaffold825_cov249-Pinguiococcus_pyrenoidosus.AAC.8
MRGGPAESHTAIPRGVDVVVRAKELVDLNAASVAADVDAVHSGGVWAGCINTVDLNLAPLSTAQLLWDAQEGNVDLRRHLHRRVASERDTDWASAAPSSVTVKLTVAIPLKSGKGVRETCPSRAAAIASKVASNASDDCASGVDTLMDAKCRRAALSSLTTPDVALKGKHVWGVFFRTKRGVVRQLEPRRIISRRHSQSDGLGGGDLDIRAQADADLHFIVAVKVWLAEIVNIKESAACSCDAGLRPSHVSCALRGHQALTELYLKGQYVGKASDVALAHAQALPSRQPQAAIGASQLHLSIPGGS